MYQSAAASDAPQLIRDRSECMSCHATGKTQRVPGYLVRSVYVSESGLPFYSLGTTTVDHSTPLTERFGGWYVTGTHGTMRHRGNSLADEDASPPVDWEPGANCHNLDPYFRTAPYVRPESDIVALMVLEHQSQMHNYITNASYTARQASHYDETMNRVLQRPADYRSETTVRRIESAGEKLVRYMLFCDEAPLTDRINGNTDFAVQFVSRGPKDTRGRSLRDFDLQKRMFRYPCSFLIYSESFNQLPRPMFDFVRTRLWTILRGHDTSSEFKHLSTEDRTAILEILCETQPMLFAEFILGTKP